MREESWRRTLAPTERVVTASSDKTARIWDADTGIELITLKGHEDAVSAASFSPDGERVLTASYDKMARIWPLDLLSAAQREKPRELTPDEVDRYEVGSPEERAAYRRNWKLAP